MPQGFIPNTTDTAPTAMTMMTLTDNTHRILKSQTMFALVTRHPAMA